MIFERVMAGIVLTVCVLLLLRLALGARRRARVDAAARRAYLAVRQLIVSTRHRREAMRVADEAIKRARDRGEWDGNVYKPKSFRKPPRDKMH
jgi:hypothetical protein